MNAPFYVILIGFYNQYWGIVSPFRVQGGGLGAALKAVNNFLIIIPYPIILPILKEMIRLLTWPKMVLKYRQMPIFNSA